MAIQGDNIALYLSGQQVSVPNCNIAITQPTIKRIVALGEGEFLTNLQLLGKTEKFVKDLRADNSQLAMLSDFQLLLVMIGESQEIKKSVNKFFDLIMPDYEISIEENLINFRIEGKTVGQLHPFNFQYFQRVIIELFEPKGGNSKDDYAPVNDKAAEIAEKLRKGKEKIAQQKNKNQDLGSLFGTYISALSVALHIDINTLYNYTPFQLYDSFERYFAKMQSDLYKKICTTPLMDASKLDEPEDWIRNLYR